MMGMAMKYTGMERPLSKKILRVIYAYRLLAGTYLKRNYSAICSNITGNGAGKEKLFKQVSFSGSVPRHVISLRKTGSHGSRR